MTDNVNEKIMTLGTKIIEADIRVHAIASILVGRGIISSEELDDKFDLFKENSFEYMKNELLQAIKEFGSISHYL